MSEINQNQSKLLYIAIGILVPIIAALVPYAYKYCFPEHELNYSILSSTQVKEFKSVSLQLVNNGENVEKHVTVLIQKSEFTTPEKYGYLDNFLLDIEPKLKYNLSETADYIVVGLGNLRPREKLDISFISPNLAASFSSWSSFHEGNFLTIKSDDNLAKLIVPSDFLEFFYPVSFWTMSLLIAITIILGLYFEYFQSKDHKKKRINKSIEYCKKELEKLESN
jgi:hypothetical protein